MSERKRKKVGEILVSQGIITYEQLTAGLEEHHQTGESLGSVLVKKGYISYESLFDVLNRQIEDIEHQKVGETLVAYGYITPEQLALALEEQKVSKAQLGKVLAQLGYIDEVKLIDVLSAQLDIPHILLDGFPFRREVATLIPRNLAEKYKMIALFRDGKTLTVATSDPTHSRALDHIKFKTGMEIEPLLSTEKGILAAIAEQYAEKPEPAVSISLQIEDPVSPVSSDPAPSVIPETPLPIVEKPVVAEIQKQPPVPEKVPQEIFEPIDAPPELPVEKPKDRSQAVAVIHAVISGAVKNRASGIHLEPTGSGLRVRYRVGTELREQNPIAMPLYPALVSKLKAIAGMDEAVKPQPQVGRFRMRVDGKEIGLRISTFPCLGDSGEGVWENVTIHLGDPLAQNMELEQLGILPEILKGFSSLLKKTESLILLAGPARGGKTTTLYAVARYLARPEISIFSLEDPVEAKIEGISQAQVEKEKGLDFTQGLRFLRRQDPDIILIDAIRDRAAFEAALEAVREGRRVIAVVESEDSFDALDRLQAMGIAPALISSYVSGILAQRLVRLVCPYCKESYTPASELLQFLGLPAGALLWKGRGCPACQQSGYAGKTAVFELLAMDEPKRSALLHGAGGKEIRELHGDAGTLRPHGLSMARKGITTIQQVMNIAGKP